MRVFTSVLAVTALIAIPALAQDTAEKAAEEMIPLFEQNKCVIDEAMVAAHFEGKDFSPSSIDDAFDLLEDNGSIIIADSRDSARLTTGEVCSAMRWSPESDAEKQAVALFEENGCRLTRPEFRNLAEKADLDSSAMRKATRTMMDNGALSIDGDHAVLTIGEACASAPAETQEASSGKEAPVPSEEDRRATITRVFEENGCSLTEQQADEKLAAAGLDQSRDGNIVMAMIREGLIEVNENKTLATLVTGEACGTDSGAKVASDSPRAILTSVLEENGCRLSEREFVDAMTARGYDEDRIDEIGEAAEDLVEAGVFSFGGDSGNEALILSSGEVCGSGEEPDTAAAGDPRSEIVALFERNECKLTEKLFTDAFSDDIDPYVTAVEAMFEAGDVVEGPDDTGILVTGEKCGALMGDRKAMLVTALEQNDCALTEEKARDVLAEVGMAMDEAENIAEAMVEAGEARFERTDGAEKLVLQNGEVCGK